MLLDDLLEHLAQFLVVLLLLLNPLHTALLLLVHPFGHGFVNLLHVGRAELRIVVVKVLVWLGLSFHLL